MITDVVSITRNEDGTYNVTLQEAGGEVELCLAKVSFLEAVAEIENRMYLKK